MRVNIVDRSAIGLIFLQMNDSMISDLLECLHGHQQSLQTNPLAMLGIIFENIGRLSSFHLTDSLSGVDNIELQTRMTSIMGVSPEPIQINHELLNKHIHFYNTILIFLDWKFTFQVGLAKFIKETLNKLEAAHEQRGLTPDPADVLQQNMDYMINVVEQQQLLGQTLQRRIQSQISVVSRLSCSRTQRSGTLLICS